MTTKLVNKPVVNYRYTQKLSTLHSYILLNTIEIKTLTIHFQLN
ncbi:hypothetical protein EZS27_014695 [termite gut metagenome]|uniref:Uncharacterized protein n=1 Tax=termite gut metagenome TaxID=433724 RepID=A0A5J4RW53_9ZZZZ